MADACRKRPVYVKIGLYIWDQYTWKEKYAYDTNYMYDTNIHEKGPSYIHMNLMDCCYGRCLSKETSICEKRPIYMRPIHTKREICVRHQQYARYQYTWKGFLGSLPQLFCFLGSLPQPPTSPVARPKRFLVAGFRPRIPSFVWYIKTYSNIHEKRLRCTRTWRTFAMADAVSLLICFFSGCAEICSITGPCIFCGVLQRVATRCSVLHCVALCCSDKVDIFLFNAPLNFVEYCSVV